MAKSPKARDVLQNLRLPASRSDDPSVSKFAKARASAKAAKAMAKSVRPRGKGKR
jgi:hypothetical protein